MFFVFWLIINFIAKIISFVIFSGNSKFRRRRWIW